MQEQLDISSFRCPPLSSFSPTYVSGWEKKRIAAQTDKDEPVRSFSEDASVQSLSQPSLHLAKAQTRHLCTPRSMQAKKVGSPTADI
jgi:hypothetical protein